MKKQKVIFFDLVLISAVVASVILLFVFLDSPGVSLSPSEGLTETSVLFWLDGDVEKILVDDNSDFSSPEEYFISEGLRIHLSLGEKYWKIVRGDYDEIRKFEVEREINLLFKENHGGGFDVLNAEQSDYIVVVQEPKGEERIVTFSGGGSE